MNRKSVVLGLFLVLCGGPVQAQKAGSLTADLVKATADVESKLMALAGALSAPQYDWRPGTGVRSVGEVLLHVASDNYFLPAAMGIPAPAATKITGSDYAAVQAFERQKLSRDATIAELKASFDFLKKSMESIPESRMNETIKVFGQDFTVRSFLILATTHLHEHLGQMIAYARVNSVKPPWSR